MTSDTSMVNSSCLSTPRLSVTADTSEAEKIAQSESLNALFSYFKNWGPKDPSLVFKSDSIVTAQSVIGVVL